MLSRLYHHRNKLLAVTLLLISIGLFLWIRELASWLPRRISPAHGFVRIAPNGRWMVEYIPTHRVTYLWDLEKEQIAAELPLSTRDLKFSSDSRLVLLQENVSVGAQPIGSKYSLVESETGRVVQRFRFPESRVADFGFSRDQQEVAVITDKRTWFFDTESGKIVRHFALPFPKAGDVRYDGRQILVAHRGKVAVYETQVGKLVRRMDITTLPTLGVEGFSPDGTIYYNERDELTRWRLSDQKLLGSCGPIKGDIVTFEFSSNSRYLADHIANRFRICDVRTGEISEHRGPTQIFTPFAIAPDASFIITSDEGKGLRRWRLK